MPVYAKGWMRLLVWVLIWDGRFKSDQNDYSTLGSDWCIPAFQPVGSQAAVLLTTVFLTSLLAWPRPVWTLSLIHI